MARNDVIPEGIGLARQEAGEGQRGINEDQANAIQLEGQANPPLWVCDICADQGGEGQQVLRPKTYKSENGLKVHKARKHPVVRHAEIAQVADPSRSVHEHDHLIIAEAELMKESEVRSGTANHGINQLILNALGTEQININRIKYIRKTASYKSILARKRREKEAAQNVGEDVDVGSADEYDNDFVNDVHIEPSTTIPTVEQDHRRDKFMEVFSNAATEDLCGLSAARCIGACAMEVRLATIKVLDSVGCKLAAPEPRGRRANFRPPQRPTSNKKAKARRFYKAQTLYRKSPGGCFKAVLDDTLDTEDGVSSDAKEDYWQTLFERTANFERTEPTTTRPTDSTLADPITRAEVKEILKSAKATSPGADKVDRKLLRKIGPDRLHVLFNLFLLTSIVPEELKLGRVTLIPKTEKPEEPKDFRPITVGSMILRSYHSLLCRRLAKVPIKGTQKGFQTRDGIGENTSILKGLFEKVRKEKRSLYLCLLDVSKAFDSVAHPAIIAALERLGVPQELITYIKCLYTDARVLVGGRYVRLGRGVRQGCPLSTFLFNAVIDMCLDGVEMDFGFKLDENISIADLFFADDGVLVSDTDKGLQRLLNYITERFRKVGLELNASKSHSLAFPYSGVRRRNYVSADSFLKVGEVSIPGMNADDRAKYLGIFFGYNSFKPIEAVGKFAKLASRVRVSPLTPAQKFHCVKSAMVPRMLHQLVLSDCPNHILVSLDLSLRKLVRQILKLPNDVSCAAIHGHASIGSLGIPSFQATVKRLRYARVRRLGRSDCELVGYFMREGFITQPAIPKYMGKQIVTKCEERSMWEKSLEESVDQKNLVNRAFSRDTRLWWTDPEFVARRNGDFIKSVHVRLKSLSSPTRLRRRGRGDGSCTIDRTPNASLCHISQICGITYGARIKRHDALVKSLKRGLEACGWKCQMEPRIPIDTSFVKPDIIARRGNNVVVLDPAITGDSAAYLSQRFAEKVVKYSTQEVRDYCLKLQELNGMELQSFKVLGVPMTYRGDMFEPVVTELKNLGIRRGYIAYLSAGVVLDTWHVWRMYQANSRAGGKSLRRGRRLAR